MTHATNLACLGLTEYAGTSVAGDAGESMSI